MPVLVTHKRRHVVLPVRGLPCTGRDWGLGLTQGRSLWSWAQDTSVQTCDHSTCYLKPEVTESKCSLKLYSSTSSCRLHTLRLAATRAAGGLPRARAPLQPQAQSCPAQAPWACRHSYAGHYIWLCTKWTPGHFSLRNNQWHFPFLPPRNAALRCSARRSSPVLKAGKSLGHLTLPQACCKCQWLLLHRGFHHLLLHVCHLTLPRCRTEILADRVCLCISISSILPSFPATDWYYIRFPFTLDKAVIILKFTDHRSSCCSSVSLISTLPFFIFLHETMSFEYAEKRSHTVPNFKHFLLFNFFSPKWSDSGFFSALVIGLF